MRKFYLYRSVDISGVSGVGRVAEGVEFSDGSCVIHWLTKISSTGLYKSIADIQMIHGHEENTIVEWVDND